MAKVFQWQMQCFEAQWGLSGPWLTPGRFPGENIAIRSPLKLVLLSYLFYWLHFYNLIKPACDKQVIFLFSFYPVPWLSVQAGSVSLPAENCPVLPSTQHLQQGEGRGSESGWRAHRVWGESTLMEQLVAASNTFHSILKLGGLNAEAR